MEANKDYPIEKYAQIKVRVDGIKLATFADDNSIKSIDLLWMDIQGAELFALKGADDILIDIGMMHLEVEFFEIYKNQPLFKEIKKFLNDKNFRLITFTNFGKFSGDAVFVNKTLLKNILVPECLIFPYFKVVEVVKGKTRSLLMKIKKQYDRL